MGVTSPPKPATAQLDAARQFDFLLGEWDCTWGDGEQGTNSVYLDLDDHVEALFGQVFAQERAHVCFVVYDEDGFGHRLCSSLFPYYSRRRTADGRRQFDRVCHLVAYYFCQ